ncbi:vesicular protein trafficking mediator, putative [Trypanosoma brucei gambiense DAL972]|uniref:Vesicular protein trafficking mediator, putative n=1 Tax=Trypanosoma brucei gambiense (strain MHOM/CI/86/DAL972) TaxID=679716 RepID=D0A6C2_TRYB9|nr:vesicular protein trafficking mediator, putative [Trypanosoma brucei gambiense DAL972]CBH17223.1 vesicular protein trafficking mediator, putative [Trypanosoma brucei gambiense DAL972]|eukprot:XP_011779487.1 vesicular protein trafficking mediator, putative [Trypanosoma brucei gambiense DAL972]
MKLFCVGHRKVPIRVSPFDHPICVGCSSTLSFSSVLRKREYWNDMSTTNPLDVVLNMRLAVKELTNSAAASDKASEREKIKAKKALNKDNIEAARVYAENAIRKKDEGTSYLRLASRVDAAAERIQSAMQMHAMTRSLEKAICGISKVLHSLDPVQITTAMDAFERHVDTVAVNANAMDGTFERSRASAVPAAEVESFLEQITPDNEIDISEQIAVATNYLKKRPAATKVGDDVGITERMQRISIGAR